MIQFKSGSLLDADEQYIVHQTNCLSHYAAGLAKHLFERFPYADVYSQRDRNSIPGSIVVQGDGVKERYVIALMGQFYPGKPQSYGLDSEEGRKYFFYLGLNKISELSNLVSLAFPDHIGCGLAGGDWSVYLSILKEFSNSLPQVQMTIYKL